MQTWQCATRSRAARSACLQRMVVVASAGNYYASGINGTSWAGNLTWSSGSLWSRSTLDGASVWSSGFLWSNGYLWSRSLPFDTASMSSSGYLWSRALVEPAAINDWVSQE